jgi:hypothetical protein
VGKKIAVLAVALLVTGLAILGYYIQEGRKHLLSDPYKAVPLASFVVIETSDLQSFLNSLTTGKGIFGEMAGVKELQGFNIKLKEFAGLLNKPACKELLPGSTSVISFTLTPQGKYSLQLSLNVPGNIRLRHIKDILRSSGATTVTGIRSKGRTLLTVPIEVAGNDSVFISLDNGLLVCNNSLAASDEALARIIKGDDIRTTAGFERVHTTSGKNVDKFFIIYRNLPAVIQKLLTNGKQDIAVKGSKLASATGLDIYINGNGIALSGYTEATDTAQFLYKYKSVVPKELHIYRFLPAATMLFETMIMQDFQAGGSSGQASDQTVMMAEKLREFIKGEVTRAIIDIKGQPLDDDQVMIFELSSRVAAEKAFIDVLGRKPEKEYFQTDEQLRIPIYKASLAGLTGLLKPDYNPGFEETYFAFYDNYLIAGTSYSTISRILYDNILNKTLANDITYKEFESTLPSKAGYFFFCIPARIIGYLSKYLDPELIHSLEENKTALSKIQSAGFQLTASNGMIYNSMSVRYSDEVREESLTEWETLLDTLAAIKPFFFTNHNTGAKEIFIQDLNNNTYLINTVGRVLWKVPLNERITSNIFLVDYYHNGKYQMLFSGKNYLHLLDRNGNYVERYPVKLRSPATNPLAIVDYDNSLNYRLFIAGDDKMIYSYDKSGSVVKGWKPFRTAGIVSTEINYFRVSGKDFLVASDENSIYFLDRAGNVRMTPKEPVIRSKGSSMRLAQGAEPAVVCTSPDGIVQHIFFDGTVRKFNIRAFSPEHSFDIFDINGDGFGEYIFIDKGVLYLYNNKREEIFTRDFGSGDLGGPISFIFSGTNRKIGVFDPAKKLIFLIDGQGRTTGGFPLRGASMFSIGKLSEKSGWNLIVGGTDRFLYNYKIETDSK